MKPFTSIAVFIFAVICVVHVLRLLLGWEVRISSLEIPQWISILGAFFAGLLAIMLWKENR